MRVLAFFACWVALVKAVIHEDEVKSLPGLDKLTSRLYSGYIKASAANQTFYTHYLLTELFWS